VVRPPDALDRPTWVHHVVLAALCAVAAINYVQRNSISPAETTIRADLNLSRADSGDAIGAFFLAYALLQIPSGWLAQRWGGRLALTVFTAGWSVALALCALATALPTLVAGRALMGALQAGIFPCSTLILAAWYPASRRGFATAMLTSFMFIGGAVGSVLTGWLLGPLGWRGVFLVYTLPGLAWAAWFAVWFRNRPEQHSSVNPAELAVLRSDDTAPPPVAPTVSRAEGIVAHREALTGAVEKAVVMPPLPAPPARDVSQARTPWLAIFLSPALLVICVQQFSRAGASRFYDTWMPTYLQEARAHTVAEAGALASWPQWASVVGVVLGGLLSDAVLAGTRSRIAGRNGVAVLSLLAGTACFVVAYFIPSTYLAVLAVSLGALIASFAAPCAYALTMDMAGRNLGVVFGAMNMAGNLGSWAFAWFIPRLVSRSGGWNSALAVFAGLHLAAAVCWLVLNPNGTIGEHPPAPPQE
jgi:ACS family glucarate transporter-like MFS transporter